MASGPKFTKVALAKIDREIGAKGLWKARLDVSSDFDKDLYYWDVSVEHYGEGN